MMTDKEYTVLKDADVRMIDTASVPDIRNISVNAALPPVERIRDVARQMNGNPFVYRCGGILVKMKFSGTRPLQAVLEDCLEHCT